MRMPAVGGRTPLRFRVKRDSGFWGCAPAREELESLGSSVGSEDGEPEPVSGKRHDLVIQLEFADVGVPEALTSGLVIADVVCGPPRAEVGPTCGT